MAAEPDASLILQMGSIGGAVVAVLAVLTFWSKFSDRITKADSKASLALQEAAEAKNDYDNLRETMGDMSRELAEASDKRSREYGEGLAALRQHITDVAFFGRDNFVRKEDFNQALKEMKAGQESIEKKIDDVRDRLPPRK